MSKKTIIVSNRLPVTVKREVGNLEFIPSAGGLATGLGSIYKQGENIWIGWPGFTDFREGEEQHIIDGLRKDSMAPVFLTHEDILGFYEGYSNRTIWPLFHYFPEFAEYETDLWESYVSVNQKFCDEILKYAHEEDIIWVHDYQLLLLPEMLRKALPKATIAFFQHIPFPSYEIFRLLPWRSELLNGMLGADLLGFHTYDDMRHFLSSVNRILGYGNTMGKITKQNRMIAVDAFPMGIDYDKFSNAPHLPETKEKIARYNSTFSSQKIILSIDRLDYSKGIKQRLYAFDQFLTTYPEYIGKVSMVLVVVPSRDKVPQYQQLKDEIDKLVGQFDGKYNRMDWSPIHYFYRSFSFHALTALYTISEVALITPLRDGMNLVCKEFIACKTDKKGVLILSEMAGAAKELSEAILINPNDLNQMVEALNQALTMTEYEQEQRMDDMQVKLQRYNIHRWVDNFMTALHSIKDRQKEMNLKLIDQERENRIMRKYQNTDKRIFFLDYDGTLKGFSKNPKDASPDQELIEILGKLAADKKNRVVIITGRDKTTMQSWLGHLPVDIIAEHGVWLKEHETGDWKMIESLDQSWKQQIRNILELHVDRTPGSFIEDKDYSLVWHYRKADPEFGELRARELLGNLNYLTANMNLHSMVGNKVIEIKSRDVNKGKAARRWLALDDFQFIFAVGDDVTDEDTFKALPEKVYSIKVGLTASNARYNVKSFVEVRELLTKLYQLSE